MQGHDRHNTTIFSIIHTMSTTCFGQYYFDRHQVGYNMTCIALHIKASAHTPSNYFVNEISSPSTYTNTDGYTVSYYILCSFLR